MTGVPESAAAVGRRDCAAAVRALLPDIPSSTEGVEQVSGTRVTRDDREYPGGTDSGN